MSTALQLTLEHILQIIFWTVSIGYLVYEFDKIRILESEQPED